MKFESLWNGYKFPSCDYTINNNYHMPKEEMDFLKSLRRKLNSFHYNSFEILDGKGIILSGRKC